mgnify:CR=1 FL=1
MIKDKYVCEEGKWITYTNESDLKKLLESLFEHNSFWAIENSSFIKNHGLNKEKIYIYYTKDRDNRYTCPRISILTKNGEISRISGAAPYGNIESEMEMILEKKIDEFPYNEEYKKIIRELQNFTKIYSKWTNKEDLNKNDLKFLYELEHKINFIGYKNDDRINEIINTRDIKKDLSKIFDCDIEQISLTREEALKGDIIAHFGNLDLSDLDDITDIKLPKYILGNLYLSNLKSFKNNILPSYVLCDIDLGNIKSAENIIFPEYVGGSLYLNSMESFKNIKLPTVVGRYLSLDSITSLKETKLPKSIGVTLSLTELKSLEDVELPKFIGANIRINNLTEMKNVTFPRKIEGTLSAINLNIVENTIFPDSIGEDLLLNSLTTIKNVTFPKYINGTLELGNVIKSEKVIIPDELECNVKVISNISELRNKLD